MKLEKAIEIKELHYVADNTNTSEEYDEADRISIEALKLVKHLRHPEFLRHLCLLPGETDE